MGVSVSSSIFFLIFFSFSSVTLRGLLATERERNRQSSGAESRGSRPGLPVPNSPYGLCDRKASLNLNELGWC